MTVVVDEMREQIYRARIAPGVEFYCHEGSKRVALGRVSFAQSPPRENQLSI